MFVNKWRLGQRMDRFLQWIPCLTLLSGNRNVFNHHLVLPRAPPAHHGEVSNLFPCCVIRCRAAWCSSEEHKQLPEPVIHAGALIPFCAHHLTHLLRWGIISRSSSSSSACFTFTLPCCFTSCLWRTWSVAAHINWSTSQFAHGSVGQFSSDAAESSCVLLCFSFRTLIIMKTTSERDEWSSVPQGYWR